jgi:hypothetical protein
MSKRNALEIRQKLEAAHPDIKIKSPLSSASHHWELVIAGETAVFDDFWAMAHSLADRYPDVESP